MDLPTLDTTQEAFVGSLAQAQRGGASPAVLAALCRDGSDAILAWNIISFQDTITNTYHSTYATFVAALDHMDDVFIDFLLRSRIPRVLWTGILDRHEIISEKSLRKICSRYNKEVLAAVAKHGLLQYVPSRIRPRYFHSSDARIKIGAILDPVTTYDEAVAALTLSPQNLAAPRPLYSYADNYDELRTTLVGKFGPDDTRKLLINADAPALWAAAVLHRGDWRGLGMLTERWLSRIQGLLATHNELVARGKDPFSLDATLALHHELMYHASMGVTVVRKAAEFAGDPVLTQQLMEFELREKVDFRPPYLYRTQNASTAQRLRQHRIDVHRRLAALDFAEVREIIAQYNTAEASGSSIAHNDIVSFAGPPEVATEITRTGLLPGDAQVLADRTLSPNNRFNAAYVAAELSQGSLPGDVFQRYVHEMFTALVDAYGDTASEQEPSGFLFPHAHRWLPYLPTQYLVENWPLVELLTSTRAPLALDWLSSRGTPLHTVAAIAGAAPSITLEGLDAVCK